MNTIDTIPAELLTGEKECHACREVLPLSCFNRKTTAKDGHSGICRACSSAAQSARYHAEKMNNPLEDDGYFVADPCSYLARSVIKLALRDWKRHNSPRGGLIIFFRSDWFEDLADMAGLNPDVIRERLGIANPSPSERASMIGAISPGIVTQERLRE